jgi:hypothetical protein
MSAGRDDPATGRTPPATAVQSHDLAGIQDIAALGQTVAGRLLRAGLDLHVALKLIGDGPAAQRCASALDELDHAIRQVRKLVLAAHERSGDGQLPAGDGLG